MLIFLSGFQNRFRHWAEQGHGIGWIFFLVLFLSTAFQAPAQGACTLKYPTHTTINTATPTFEWGTQCGETNYLFILQYANSGVSVVSPIRVNSSQDTIQLTLNVPLQNAKYHWAVWMYNRQSYVGNMTGVFTVTAPRDFYEDKDNDGYGDPAVHTQAAGQPSGYVANAGDCDDTNPFIHPNMDEICGDGIDQDCSGADQLCAADNDGDGWRSDAGDCNDNDPSIHPFAPEVCGDGVDQDCDGQDRHCQDLVCVNLSEAPLETYYQAAPANIMFVLDNSGSMDFSFMTSGPSGAFKGYYYLYQIPNQVYGSNASLPDSEKKYWKTRWHGYNQIYYNPAIDYSPWPATGKYDSLTAFKDADAIYPQEVFVHPILDKTVVNLDHTYVTQGYAGKDIPYAHYFVRHGSDVYLVVLERTRFRYYKLNDPNQEDSKAAGYTEVTGSAVPSITNRSITEERWNFANWFCFHRNRYLVAAGALAKVINQMKGVHIGIYTINPSDPHYTDNYIVQPVVPVRIKGQDQSDTLINKLYELKIRVMGTPLREGLKAVGQYFDDTDNIIVPGLGPSPFASEQEGGACQQTFAVMVTDGHWGNYTHLNIGNQDGDAWANTLADTAMYFYKRDLSSLPNKLRPTKKDPMTSQHMVSYGVAFGVKGSIDPSLYPDCPEACSSIFPLCNACPSNWPRPDGNDGSKIDDLYHATLNGHGAIWSAKNPTELAAALNALVQDIDNRKGSAASLAANGNAVSSQLSLFQPSYDVFQWSGDLKAYPVNSVTGAVGQTPTWSASDKLNQAVAIPGWWSNGLGRKVFTNVGNGGVAFNTNYSSQIGLPASLIEYLRGDRSKEGKGAGQYRVRDGVLGDIVHSEPVPANGVVLVGGNDGMLHAFDEKTGHERFAYIPEFVTPNFHDLASQSYVHRFFVDGTPYVKNLDANTTVLVGGLGRGGKGVYCLDISPSKINPPSEFIAANTMFKWIYPTTDDPDMGYSFSRPYIVNSTAGWVAVFGNGYDSENAKACLYVVRLSDGILLRKIETGYGNAGQECNGLSTSTPIDPDNDGLVDYVYAGDLRGNLWKFDLRATNPAYWDVAYADNSGIPQPLFRAVNANGFAQPITHKPDVMMHCDRSRYGYLVLFGTGRYLGEEDFTDTSIQTLYGIWDWAEYWEKKGKNKGERFTKNKYLGQYEPSGNGERLFSNLKSETSLPDGARRVGLLSQHQVHTDDPAVRVLTDETIHWYERKQDAAGSHVGWYFDLPVGRERIFRDISIRGNVAIVVTSIPSSNICEVGGTSYLMEVNACNGGRTDQTRFDYSNDQVIDEQDKVYVDDPTQPGVRIRVAPSGLRFDSLITYPLIVMLEQNVRERKYISASNGTILTLDETPEQTGVYSWRELTK